MTAAVLDSHGGAWLTLGSAPARFSSGRITRIGSAGHVGDHWIADLRSGAARGWAARVTKPFEVSELLARIARMLQSRRRLREHLARVAAEAAVYGPVTGEGQVGGAVPSIPPAGAGLPSEATAVVDTAFVRRIREVIDSRMGEEGFGVEELAESMGMGRTLLFQRTRELLDRTPMELLMTRRLDRAAELLAAAEGNVGEVAYAVGVRSVSHFTNRFRERFQVTPSAWRRGDRPRRPASHSDLDAADARANRRGRCRSPRSRAPRTLSPSGEPGPGIPPWLAGLRLEVHG